MRIRRLKLENAFQHRKLDMKFTDFHAIIGPNGSGKSNIVESIRYMLTNEFRLPGKIETMVTDGEEKGKITMEIEDEGEMLTTMVALGDSRRSLKRGETNLKKALEVKDYIFNVLLRSTADAVNRASIIAQGGLTEGLFEPPAKRMNSFMRLAGLYDIDKKRDALHDESSKVTIPMLAFNIDDVKQKIVELETTLKLLQDEIKAFPVYDKAEVDAARSLLSQASSAANNREALKSATQHHAQKSAELKVLLGERDQTRKIVDNLSKQVAAQEQDVQKARVIVETYNELRRKWDRKQKVQQDMLATLAELDELAKVKPPETFDGGDLDELRRIRAELEAQIGQLQKTMDAFSSPTRICITCKRPCTEEEAKKIYVSAETEMSEVRSIMDEASRALMKATGEHEKWVEANTSYGTKFASAQARASSLIEEDESLGNVSEPQDPSAARNRIAQYQTLQNTLAKAEKKFDEANTKYSSMNTVVAQLATEIKTRSGSSSVSADSSELEKARKLVEDADKSVQEISIRSGRISEIERQIKEEKDKLVELEEQSKKAARLQEYIDYLEFARAALHRDQFPAGRVKTFIDRMLLSTNLYLDAMRTGFSVSYNNDTGFMAYFPDDNKTMRGDRLSGGQQITFALAFRFAVNELHTDTGFLMLDEPTVWLDDKHVEYVVQALALVKSKLKSRTQVIAVTHDERLAAACDGVSDLSA